MKSIGKLGRNVNSIFLKKEEIQADLRLANSDLLNSINSKKQKKTDKLSNFNAKEANINFLKNKRKIHYHLKIKPQQKFLLCQKRN